MTTRCADEHVTTRWLVLVLVLVLLGRHLPRASQSPLLPRPLPNTCVSSGRGHSPGGSAAGEDTARVAYLGRTEVARETRHRAWCAAPPDTMQHAC
jgi:hypothetical protein